MSEKALYCITGYVPSDDNVVECNVYKQILLGNTCPVYVWICLNDNNFGGIGTATDSYGETDQISSVINMTKYLNEYYIFGQWTFEEMMEQFECSKIKISKNLK